MWLPDLGSDTGWISRWDTPAHSSPEGFIRLQSGWDQDWVAAPSSLSLLMGVATELRSPSWFPSSTPPNSPSLPSRASRPRKPDVVSSRAHKTSPGGWRGTALWHFYRVYFVFYIWKPGNSRGNNNVFGCFKGAEYWRSRGGSDSGKAVATLPCLFFFKVPYCARISLFFINCIFLYLVPDKRQVHRLPFWLAPLYTLIYSSRNVPFVMSNWEWIAQC